MVECKLCWFAIFCRGYFLKTTRRAPVYKQDPSTGMSEYEADDFSAQASGDMIEVM